MSLVFDETFTSSIPGGFATAAVATGGSGSLGVSYNAGSSAVDLSRGAGTSLWGIWKLNNAPAAAEVDIEVDMELRTIGTAEAGPRFGIAFDRSSADGTQTLMAYLGLSAPGYSHGVVNSNGSGWGEQEVIDTVAVGMITSTTTRRLYRAQTKVQGGRRYLRFTVDGIEFSRVVDCGTVFDAALRPQILVSDGTFRIHSIRVWNNLSDMTLPVTVPLVVYPSLLTRPGPSVSGVSGAFIPPNMMIQQRLPRYYGGNGVFEGVVTIQTTTFANRKVRMYDKNTGLLVQETWSHPTTGAYRFENFDETRTYFFVAHDHLNVWNGVISDELRVS